MKFIINTYDLDVSKSMIETLLENELDNPISVKVVKEINETELDELAEENCIYCEGCYDCGECTMCADDTPREAYIEGFKAGCKEMLKRLS